MTVAPLLRSSSNHQLKKQTAERIDGLKFQVQRPESDMKSFDTKAVAKVPHVHSRMHSILLSYNSMSTATESSPSPLLLKYASPIWSFEHFSLLVASWTGVMLFNKREKRDVHDSSAYEGNKSGVQVFGVER